MQDFQKFLKEEQNDLLASNKEDVRNFMCDFLKDPHRYVRHNCKKQSFNLGLKLYREVQEPYFMLPEFLDFLFSKQNDLWDPKKDIVYQDMTKPLSHYWIASSHNT